MCLCVSPSFHTSDGLAQKENSSVGLKDNLLCGSVWEWFCQGSSNSDKSKLKLCKEFTSEIDVQAVSEQAIAVHLCLEIKEVCEALNTSRTLSS